MAYRGKERRVHKMFVTRNTEYHVRRDLCVAVRDRRSGRWLRGHLALRSRVAGGLRFTPEGGIVATEEQPAVGDALFFHAPGRDLVTSPVVSVERPPKEAVESYEA